MPINSIPSIKLVLPGDPLALNCAPCEKIKKPVRQLTDTAKSRLIIFLFELFYHARFICKRKIYTLMQIIRL